MDVRNIKFEYIENEIRVCVEKECDEFVSKEKECIFNKRNIVCVVFDVLYGNVFYMMENEKVIMMYMKSL